MKLKPTQVKSRMPWACLLLVGSVFAGRVQAEAVATAGNNLLAVYRQALLEDPQIERWQANFAASQEARNQSEARLMLPTVSANANLTGNFQTINLQGDSVGLGGYSQFVSGGYSVNLTQPLFHYDRMIALDQAGNRVKKADVELHASYQDLIIRVAERYFGLLGAIDNLHFAKTQKQALAQHRDTVHKRFDAGELTVVDLSEIDSGYDRSLSEEIEAARQLKDAREALLEVAGQELPGITPLADDIPLVAPEPNAEQPWLDQAMAENPHIMTAILSTDIARDEIERQDSAHLPTLDLVGGNQYLTTGGQFGEYDVRANTVGLVMNVSLYEGNQANSRAKEAAFRHSEAQAQLKQEQRAVHRQARDAFNGVLSGISRIQSLKQSLNSQLATVKSIRAGIEAGIRTNLDLVLAEKELLRARRDYARARYDYVLSTLRLKSAAGVLGEDDLRLVNELLQGVELQTAGFSGLP